MALPAESLPVPPCRPTPAKSSRVSTGWRTAVVLIVIGMVVLLTTFYAVVVPRVRERANRTNSDDNVRTLLTMHQDVAQNKNSGRYAPASGRAFVLWLVVSEYLDPARPGSLEVLFSPADSDAPPRPSIEEYQALTKARLQGGGDFRRFTSYVGRRTGEPSNLPVAVVPSERGTPLIADLQFLDGAIVGFSGGRVEFLSRAELGLGPDDPIVAGEASRSPILRQLAE